MSYTHLTMNERNIIYPMQFQEDPQAEIAHCLDPIPRRMSPLPGPCPQRARDEGDCTGCQAVVFIH